MDKILHQVPCQQIVLFLKMFRFFKDMRKIFIQRSNPGTIAKS